MAFTEEDKQKMDLAAGEAQQELDKLLTSDVVSQELLTGAHTILSWFAKWYISAGHKRLGRILVAEAKAHEHTV